MDKSKLDKLVDETINSMENAGRAMPAPFLLTRVKARMLKEESLGAWERVSSFLAKPLVAFPALIIVLAVNFWIIKSSVKGNVNAGSSDYSKVTTDEYSLSNATSLFDFENGQR